MEEKTRNRALIVAALTCPCHIALLPVLATGTALGVTLEAHLGWFFATATLVFLGALTVAFWKPQEPASASCRAGRCGTEEPARRSLMDPHNHEREESWRAAAPR
jgi:cyanate permease